jgi:hypothetical protein
MRKFFYDTEFIEYPSTIDLISIGIVNGNGEALYRINKECDFEKANPWVKDNVISKLPPKSDPAWVTRDIIRDDIIRFLNPSKEDPIQLYGYYSAYDHVALCWLFGPMIELPEGMPMYTTDIKQLAMHFGNPKLPEQEEGEHDALADARWNRQAYRFLVECAKEYGFKLEV